jgi:hypothetical protein
MALVEHTHQVPAARLGLSQRGGRAGVADSLAMLGHHTHMTLQDP